MSRNLVGGWYDSTLTARGVEDARRIAAALTDLVSDDGGTLLFSSGNAGWIHFLPSPARSRGTHETPRRGGKVRVATCLGGRLYAALDRIIGSEARDRILGAEARDTVVVTHGGSATYLIAAWIGLPLAAAGYVKFRLFPGSITHLNEDDFHHDRRVLDLNLTGHLGIPETRA